MVSFSLEVEPIIFSGTHHFQSKIYIFQSLLQLDKAIELQRGQWDVEESLMKPDVSV